MSSVCVRLHCAIRSHYHQDPEVEVEVQPVQVEELQSEVQPDQCPQQDEQTFADFLQLPGYFRDIASLFTAVNNKELIDNYNIMSEPMNGNHTRYTSILKKMVSDVINEPIFKLEKLRIVYLFIMLDTKHARIIRTEYPKFEITVRAKFEEIMISQDCVITKNFIKNFFRFV